MRQETRGEDREVLPLVAALEQYWGRVGFVAIPIGHASTTLTRTLDQLTAAFSTVREKVDHTSASKGTSQPNTDSDAMSHDYRLFKSLLDAFTVLAQSRLLGIIRNRKRLVEALSGAVRRNRAHSTATPTHTKAATQQGVATLTHRTRTMRVSESTAITINGCAAGKYHICTPASTPFETLSHRTVYPTWAPMFFILPFL
jgi:hypothetical protein